MVNMQSSKKHTVNARAILVFFVAVVVFLLILSSVIELFIKYRTIRTHIGELKEEQVVLEQKKTTLTSTNEYIMTDEGKERAFRDKYRLVKPGEGMIIITQEQTVSSSEARRPGLRGFWDSLLQGLGLR